MALTKEDWRKHYEAEQRIESIGIAICNYQEDIDYLQEYCADAECEGCEFCEEIKSIAEQIAHLQSECVALRKDLIPTTPEGDSVESLQDAFYPPPQRPEY